MSVARDADIGTGTNLSEILSNALTPDSKKEDQKSDSSVSIKLFFIFFSQFISLYKYKFVAWEISLLRHFNGFAFTEW